MKKWRKQVTKQSTSKYRKGIIDLSNKYYERNIARLWQGKASIKDYEVEKAIQMGGAILTLTETNEKMFLSVEQLESALLTKTKKIIPPRFKGEKPFRLCNVFWKNKENKDQGSFFDQQLNKIKMEIK